AKPALLTSRSQRSTPAQKAATLSGSATSRTLALAPRGAATASRRSRRRAPSTRSKPAEERPAAAAAPMPAEAPVTTARGRAEFIVASPGSGPGSEHGGGAEVEEDAAFAQGPPGTADGATVRDQ